MEKDFIFKVNLLKYLWNNRDRKIINNLNGIVKQKFLFFYNSFAKINDYEYTFNQLKAFKEGPVFYDIYKAAKNEFLEKLDIEKVNLNVELAQITLTLIYLFKNQLSTITHSLDMWKTAFEKEKNDISENFLSQNDIFKLKTLFNETKNVYNNYQILFNKNSVPLLLKKEEKNYIINNFNDIVQSYDSEDKSPTFVIIDNNEVYFD